MTRRKSREEKRKEKNKNDKIKEELDELMNESEMPQMGEKDAEQLEQDLRQGLPQEDYHEIDKNLKSYAENLIDSIFDFYLDNDLISEESYINFRKQTSASNIASVFFQIKTLKDSIIAVMSQIQQGNVEPRMYEVLGQLQQKYNEAIKTQANFTLYLEESFKKIAQEATDKDESKNNAKISTQQDTDKQEAVEAPATDEDGNYVSAGTKNLIKEIKSEIESESDGSENSEDYDGELTDPKNKHNIIGNYTSRDNLSADLKQGKDAEHNKTDIKKLKDLI